METSAFASSPEKSALIARFLELLPPEATSAIGSAFAGERIDVASLENALTAVDWAPHRDLLEDLLSEFIPVERLVPSIYAKWRPVVRDGFGFIGARLSPQRLIPKLVEQLTMPADAPVEERVLSFIRRVPALQKIGQTLARNTNLDPALRHQLALLEDDIREVDAQEILSEVETQLGDSLVRYRIRIQPELYGEGSVSALLKFTSGDYSTLGFAGGLFKVLKPFITRYFREDLALLNELAGFFEQNQQAYQLGQTNLRAIVENVRELYERETDFASERQSLLKANRRFSDIPGVKVPRPIGLLSTRTITAMTEERSAKITDAFPHDPIRRRETARRLIESLVARPLFSEDENSIFHADPHAGNLRVDERTGDIVLLDWALSGTLSAAERRSLILLFAALPLRDEGQVLAALTDLSLSKDEPSRAKIKRLIESFMDALPLGAIPKANMLGDLLNDLLRAGIRFSGAFLIFRKMLSTLEDVVVHLFPGEDVQKVVIEYAITNGLLSKFGVQTQQTDFRVPLSKEDYFRVGLSAQSFLPRVWMQSVRSVLRNTRSILPTPRQVGSHCQ